jgi:hypothetical protein
LVEFGQSGGMHCRQDDPPAIEIIIEGTYSGEPDLLSSQKNIDFAFPTIKKRRRNPGLSWHASYATNGKNPSNQSFDKEPI